MSWMLLRYFGNRLSPKMLKSIIISERNLKGPVSGIPEKADSINFGLTNYERFEKFKPLLPQMPLSDA